MLTRRSRSETSSIKVPSLWSAGVPPALSSVCAIRERADFLARAVLDRMLHEHHRRVVAERLVLRRCRDLEFRRRNPDRDDPELFKAPDVMHTARRAGTSIGQPFDHEVAFRLDPLLQLDRSEMGEVLLAIALYGVAAGRQQLVEPIEELIALHFGNIEQPDRLSGNGLRPREAWLNGRRRLSGGIEENVFRHRYLISLVIGFLWLLARCCLFRRSMR